MSRYSNANGGSSNGDNDNDYDDDKVFKLTKYCQVEGTIDRFNQFSGDYGQTGILGYSDLRVLDGMLYERLDDSNKLKVFAWDSLYERDDEGDLPDEVDVNSAPDRKSEEVAGNTYKYKLIDAAIEDTTDPIEVGDVTMFLSNSSASRTLMKTLTTAGHDAIVDPDDEYGWMLGDLELRNDLDGRRVIHFHVQESWTPPENDSPVTYTTPVVLDAKTEERITIDNDESDDGKQGSLDGTSGTSETSDPEVPSGVPDEADGLIDYFARTGEQEKENVEQMLESELDDMSAVDMDSVMSEIQARA